jgi:hypothetical protein
MRVCGTSYERGMLSRIHGPIEHERKWDRPAFQVTELSTQASNWH